MCVSDFSERVQITPSRTIKDHVVCCFICVCVCVWRCIIIRFHTLSPDMSCFSEFEAFLFLPCSHETSLDWFTVIPLIKTNRCIFYNHLILNLSNSYSLTSEPFPVYRCPIHGGLFQKTNNGAQRDAIQRSSYCLSHRGSTKHNIIWRGGGMIMCVCVCAMMWLGWEWVWPTCF